MNGRMPRGVLRMNDTVDEKIWALDFRQFRIFLYFSFLAVFELILVIFAQIFIILCQFGQI